MMTDSTVKDRTRKWHAAWIWNHAGKAAENNVYYSFRKEFTLNEGAQQGAWLYITAETGYQVFLNGAIVGTGPVSSQPYYKYYDVYPVENFLQTGLNTIAVVGYFSGHVEETRGGLLAELTDRFDRPLVCSDPGWRTSPAKAWRPGSFKVSGDRITPYQEVYDARKEPAGWLSNGFDDSGWEPAEKLVNDWHFPVAYTGATSDYPTKVTPWTYLLQRDIPFMRETSALPFAIVYEEECIHLQSRGDKSNLSLLLSTAGGPIRYTLLEGADQLLHPEGETIIRNGVEEAEGFIYGIYDPCIVLDFGQIITARIELEIADGTAGGTVDVGYSERLVDGRFVNHLECQFTDRFILKTGVQRFRPFAWEAFRYVKLRFSNCKEPIRLKAVRAVRTQYPFEERGRFSSTDPVLNKVFEICRNTIQLCSHESIMDTPWREKGQWLGDVSAVTLGGIYACFGDTALPGKFLKQSGENQYMNGLLSTVTNMYHSDSRAKAVISDFSLWWIHALWEHYMYTGEEEWIHRFYPNVIRVVQLFMKHRDEDGLLNQMPFWTFIDWVRLPKEGASCTLNALFYGILHSVEKMAELKGDRYELQKIGEARAKIEQGFDATFWNGETGFYADANLDGVLSREISEHANCLPILYGLCSAEKAEQLVRKLYEERTVNYIEAQPFFTANVLKALNRLGRDDLAVALIRDRWGRRMVDRGATSTYEEWGANGSWRSGEYEGYTRSQSHAWSAFPAEYLLRWLTGLEILEPGCGKIRLAPKKPGFYYTACYPMPQGTIKIIYDEAGFNYDIPEEIKQMIEKAT